MNTAASIWAKVLAILEGEMGMSRITISTWFDDITALSFTNKKLILSTPESYKKEIIEKQYTDKICEALRLLFSEDMGFDIYDESELSSKEPDEDEPSDEYSFERFIVGDSNRFAHAAAQAVASSPGKVYNPLLIYGESGLGKTHLLKAISAVIKKNNPKAKVVYIKGDDFTVELIGAIQSGTLQEFRNKYRESDALLVDDIQFIAGKVQTQEEFFHTFNTLYEAKKQIVLISDRPPKEMLTLENRLRSRFESDLIVDIQPPNFETRVAIISLKANRLGLQLEHRFKEIIANNITANVRQLEGVVKKISAYADLLSTPITEDTIFRAIEDMHIETREQTPTPELIVKEVAKYYQLEESEIKGRDRSKRIAIPRQIAIYLIREICEKSYPEIGAFFGRDHSTIMDSYRKMDEEMKKQGEINKIIKDIRNNILQP